MRIATATLLKGYLLLAVTYYIGYWIFLVNLLPGSGSGDAFSANASGSLDKQLLGVLLLLGGLFLLLRLSRRRPLAVLALGFWWLLLVAYFFASTGWSYAPGVSVRRTIAFLTLLVAAYCLVEFFEPAGLLLFCARAIGVAGGLGLLYAVVAPGQAFMAEGGLRAHAFLGIFEDKNGGARMYAYAVILTAGLGRLRDRRDQATVLVCSLCLLMSQSASSAVMLVTGSGLALAWRWLHSRFQKVNLRRFVVLTLLLALAAVVAFHLYGVLLSLLGRDPTLTNRSIIWELLAPYVEAEYWFGYGFGAFWASSAVSGFMERWGYIGNAHNSYIEALLHGGVVCLVLMVIILAKALKESAVSYVRHPRGGLFAPVLAIVLVQIVVNSVAFVVLNHNSFDMFLFALLYFIAVRGAMRVREHSRRQRRQPARLQGRLAALPAGPLEQAR